ncbi:hypothetical protein [Nocardioides sp. CFH 31398]|uniref:hypothetical protein n=1 Tax=Nocardioides sp. CFH 31398 TaxID=2919579 RepID=UPI001F067335|nr:hypothetical protein [Nocardioides sp. CFH 31398]MCH1864961.1 hypothetical protein [Nocardioides sp. CFH 31398]
MTSRGATVLALVVLVITVGLAAGCGADAPGPAAATGVAWADGDRIRLASGAERRVDGEVLWFAETTAGVAYLPATQGGSTDGGDPLGSPLLLDDGRGDPLELAADASAPVASPDGRWLAWNELDTEQRQVRLDLVLYDVTTGERSRPFPPDTGLRATRLTDTVAYVTTFDEVLVLDLATGASRPARGAARDVLDVAALSSPDGRWRTDVRGEAAGVVSADGDPVELDLPGPELLRPRWIDDDTVVGVVPDVPTEELATGETTGADLVACDVPAGTCGVVPGTRDRTILLPDTEEPTQVSASGPSGYED